MVSSLKEEQFDLESIADAPIYPLIQSGFGILQASSEWDPSHSAWRGALYFDKTRQGCQGWSAAHNDLNQWLQLSSQRLVQWKSILTQGRGDQDHWVTRFVIQYNRDGVEWLNYDGRRIFQANNDRNTVVSNDLDLPLVARAIRIIPLNWHGQIAMRLDAHVSDETKPEEHEPDSLIWVPAIDFGLPVTSSSEWNPSHGVSRIRLNFNMSREGPKCWVAGVRDLNQWVQIYSAEPRSGSKLILKGEEEEMSMNNGSPAIIFLTQ